MQNYNKRLILERIKYVSNSRTDKELAEKLGVPSPSTLANWKNPPKEQEKPTFWDYVFQYAEKYEEDLNVIVLDRYSDNQLSLDEQMLLDAYRLLDQAQKKAAILQMSGLGNGASGGVVQNGDGGNNNQVFNGNVREVTGIRK